jgi:hypothetical protein
MRDAHMRGSSTTGTIVVAALLALLIVPLFASCLVVEVHARGAESTHLLIPVPLNIARLAMRCIPAAEFDARMPAEVAARKEQILAALKAIEDAPDTTFVSVNAPDAKVMIGKRGDDLVLDITGDRDGTVKGTLPLAAVRRPRRPGRGPSRHGARGRLARRPRPHPPLLKDRGQGSAVRKAVVYRWFLLSTVGRVIQIGRPS